MKKYKKYGIVSALLIVAIVLVGFASYQYLSNGSSGNSSQAVAFWGWGSTQTSNPVKVISDIPAPTKVTPKVVNKSNCRVIFNVQINLAKSDEDACLKDPQTTADECGTNYADDVQAALNSYKACMGTPDSGSPSAPAPAQPPASVQPSPVK